MNMIMFDLNVFLIKCPIDEKIDSGFGIRCLVYKMVSLMSYGKSDAKDLSVYLR